MGVTDVASFHRCRTIDSRASLQLRAVICPTPTAGGRYAVACNHCDLRWKRSRRTITQLGKRRSSDRMFEHTADN